jgi:hypothetical protein
MEPEVDEVEELEDQVEDETAKPPASKPDPDKDAAKATERELREEIKGLKSRATEAEDNAKFWHGKAAATPKAAAKEVEEEDVPLSSDLVDAISSGDKKLVQKLFKEMGFVSSRDLDNKIGQTRAQITEESKLYGKYPDLQDNKSEFFQSAARHYNDLAQDPTLAKSPKLIEIAARLAKAEIGDGEEVEERKAPTRRDREQDEETDRVRRVSAQAGPRGTLKSRAAAADESGELNAAQIDIVKRFQSAGSALTADMYKTRATKGVRMSGSGRSK